MVTRETPSDREEIAYAISHDLREPLRVVVGFSELLAERLGPSLDEPTRTLLAHLTDGAMRMRGMLDGLVAYLRIDQDPGPIEQVDLDALVAEMVASLDGRLRSAGGTIALAGMPVVAGRRRQLRELFAQLIDNGLKFHGEKPPRLALACVRDGDRWRFTVRDEGIGFDTNSAARAFRLFQRLHERGRHDGPGVGLALCRRIVEGHGGEIAATSIPGVGTTITFTLVA